MNLTIPLLFLFLISPITTSSATSDDSDNGCIEILQQGIYNYLSVAASSAQAYQEVAIFCSAYNQYTESSHSSKSTFSFVDFSIGDTFSSSQLTTLASLMCTKSSSSQTSQTELSLAESLIDSSVIAAYQACVNQLNSGLTVNTNLRESDQSEVTIQLDYTPQFAGPVGILVTGVSISPPTSWSCSGPLLGSLNVQTVGAQTLGLSCTRNVSSQSFKYQEISIYAGASTITIFTNVGAVTRSFDPIYAGPSNLYESLVDELQGYQTIVDNLEEQLATVRATLNSKVPPSVSCGVPVHKYSYDYGYQLAFGTGKPAKIESVDEGVAFYACI